MEPKPTIEVRPRTYQPTKVEINEQFSMDTTPSQLANALLRDVDVRKAPVPKSRTRRTR